MFKDTRGIKFTYFVAAMCIALMLGVTAFGQVSLTNAAPMATINFDTTVAGVNNGQFTGTGFQSTPLAGQLDSDAFMITGFSDGDLAFGGTRTTVPSDYTRGTTTGGVTTGGVYALNPSPAPGGGAGLWVQPVGDDFTPGTITLRILNNGTTNITSLQVNYDIIFRNDQTRSQSLNFSFSNNNITYTPVPALDFATPAAADALGNQSVARTTTITGITVVPGDNFYIRFSSDDLGTAGSSDEIGIDNVAFNATFAPIVTAGEVFVGGRVVDARGYAVANATVTINGGPLTQPRTATTSGFGYFGFSNVSVGNTYIISAAKNGYTFEQPDRVVTVNEDENTLLFTGSRIFDPLSRDK